MFQRDSAEFGRGEGLEGAVERSYGGTGGSEDDNFCGGLKIALTDGD